MSIILIKLKDKAYKISYQDVSLNIQNIQELWCSQYNPSLHRSLDQIVTAGGEEGLVWRGEGTVEQERDGGHIRNAHDLLS